MAEEPPCQWQSKEERVGITIIFAADNVLDHVAEQGSRSYEETCNLVVTLEQHPNRDLLAESSLFLSSNARLWSQVMKNVVDSVFLVSAYEKWI